MKRYSVYVAGGSYVTTVEATCIKKGLQSVCDTHQARRAQNRVDE